MARTRSPNYPYIGLPAALDRVRKLYDKEHHNRMSRQVVANQLGFGSLNGISMSVISALTKYGLLVSVGDYLQVSDDALTILVDPPDSEERAQAIRRAALKPELFSEIHKHFGGQIPSDVNLLSYLQKHGFTANAGAQAGKSFRETMQLISGQNEPSNGTGRSEGQGMQGETHREPPKPAAKPNQGEREFFSSPLSSQTRVRILIEGPAGPKEIDKLIRILTVQKEIIQEGDNNGE